MTDLSNETSVAAMLNSSKHRQRRATFCAPTMDTKGGKHKKKKKKQSYESTDDDAKSTHNVANRNLRQWTCGLCGIAQPDQAALLLHTPRCYRFACIEANLLPFCTCPICRGTQPHPGDTLAVAMGTASVFALEPPSPHNASSPAVSPRIKGSKGQGKQHKKSRSAVVLSRERILSPRNINGPKSPMTSPRCSEGSGSGIKESGSTIEGHSTAHDNPPQSPMAMVRGCLRQIKNTDEPRVAKMRCLEALLDIINPILANPEKERLRNVPVNSETYIQNVAAFEGAEAILQALRFQKQFIDYATYMVLQDTEPDTLLLLKGTREAIEKILAGWHKHKVSKHASNILSTSLLGRKAKNN
eukprot:TRINITY_DN6568_c0_g1_i1.p1 TRINITY_DN6568_c0_g1~~TRINITY_DN6568_c0_g1_i1.p1  ORF type:complete len:357 (+),score=37.89 TRINITY_DN6568_c0_g1_i1:1279-2349(+)